MPSKNAIELAQGIGQARNRAEAAMQNYYANNPEARESLMARIGIDNNPRAQATVAKGVSGAIRDLAKGVAKGAPKAMAIFTQGLADEKRINAQTRQNAEEVMAPARAETIRQIGLLPGTVHVSPTLVSGLIETVSRSMTALLGTAERQAGISLEALRGILREAPVQVTNTTINEEFERGRLGKNKSVLVNRTTYIHAETPVMPKFGRVELPRVELQSAEAHSGATMKVGEGSYARADFTQDGGMHLEAGGGSWDSMAGAAGEGFSVSGGSINLGSIEVRY